MLPVGDTQLIARLRNGIGIIVDVRDFNGRMLYLFGTPDPKVVATCSALLRSGDCFLDIGANYGSVGFLCSKSVGNEGVVHLFEPQPELCRRIHTAIDEHSLDNVRLHEVGLMNRDDVIEMARPFGHSGSASFVPDRKRRRCVETRRLQVRNITTYLPQLIGDRPFAAKVDVEGAEPHLLPWLLQQSRLRFLVFESQHLHEMDPPNHALVGASFALFGLRKTLLRMRLERVTSQDQQHRYHDMLAVRVNPAVHLPNRLSPTQLRSLILNEKTD